jgi:hypothetical protein
MNLKRGSVFGVLILSLVLISTVEAHAQAGVPGRIAALQTQVDQALAKIAQLQAALAAEASARQAADTTLQNNINAIAGGGVTQAAVDAAIAAEATARDVAVAAEASLRAAADTALEGQIATEAATRSAFDATLAPLTALAPLATYVSVNTATINGLAGPHVIFSGVNVHIRSGHTSGNSYTQNGKGNLILGYNEPSDSALPTERGGSHNVVVGPNHRYNFGVGLVVGGENKLGADGASVSGGFSNTALGLSSSVTGGFSNTASGEYSSVSAGARNSGSGDFSSVSGGVDNTASGNTAAVSAGQGNIASGDLSSVSGGMNNTASGVFSTVGGGNSLTNAGFSSFIP